MQDNDTIKTFIIEITHLALGPPVAAKSGHATRI